MPPPMLFDLNDFDPNRVEYTPEQIYERLPHRHEFMQLSGVSLLDTEGGRAAAFRDIKDGEFWTRGHIPGRPIFPGVLMLEAAAQLASFYAMMYFDFRDRFLGFGGVDKVKFRASVGVNTRLIILARAIQAKPRRVICATQGIVDDQMVFEAEITGMPV